MQTYMKKQYKSMNILNEAGAQSVTAKKEGTYEDGAQSAIKNLMGQITGQSSGSGGSDGGSGKIAKTPDGLKNPTNLPQHASNQGQQGQNGQQQGGNPGQGGGQQAQEGQDGDQQGSQEGGGQQAPKNDSSQGGQGGGQGNGDKSQEAAEGGIDFAKGYKEGLEDAAKGRHRSTQGMSAKEAEGYEKAQQEVKEFQEKSTPTVDGGNTKGGLGVDRVSKDFMDKIAKEAGQPIRQDDGAFEDPDHNAQEYVGKMMNDSEFNAIGSAGNKGASRGGGTLGERMNRIRARLKSVVSWKNKLRSHFNKAAKTRKQTEMTRYTSRISRDAINQYVKDNPVAGESKNAISQIFYLIDGSGSMFGSVVGNKIFNYVMGEILALEKATNIRNSALTYFCSDIGLDAIKRGAIKRWNHATQKSKVMDMIAYDENQYVGGGTDIVRSIIQTRALPKPYFDNSPNGSGTLLIVITDGEDDLSAVKSLSLKERMSTLFLIINSKQYDDSAMQVLTENGIPEKNVILVDEQDVKKSLDEANI